MKTAVKMKNHFLRQPIVPLPNAINRRQFLHKLLDKALIAVSGVGIAVALFFLLMLF